MTVAEDLAALDECFRAMGIPDQRRAEMSAEWREIALLPDDDPDKKLRGLAAIGRELPFSEAYVRACGDDELADAFGRCAVAVSLWLELPARLAEFAGLPDLQPKREKP